MRRGSGTSSISPCLGRMARSWSRSPTAARQPPTASAIPSIEWTDVACSWSRDAQRTGAGGWRAKAAKRCGRSSVTSTPSRIASRCRPYGCDEPPVRLPALSALWPSPDPRIPRRPRGSGAPQGRAHQPPNDQGHPMPNDYSDLDDLLRPREVAELLGVRTTPLARWAREGRLPPLRTPGGHRRYPRSAVMAVRDDETTAVSWAEDAVRLYEQGWSIRQVAEKFDCGYGVMRRVLRRRVTLRSRGGRPTE